MTVRTKVRLFLAALAVSVGFGVAATSAPASAVCGGGAPGEPCYCPGPVTVGKYTVFPGVQC